jgi:hypothetical protein
LTTTRRRCADQRREARSGERDAAEGVAAAAICRAHRGRDVEGIHGRFALQHFVEQARALGKMELAAHDHGDEANGLL